MFSWMFGTTESTSRTLADGTVEKVLPDGSIEHTYTDGHHEVVTNSGDIELDDVGSDKDSYTEEVDVTDAEGKVHHVKKWHHHSVDHFKRHGYKYGATTIVIALSLGLGLGLGLMAIVASTNNDAAIQAAALAASVGTTMEPVTVIPAKGEGSRRRLLSGRSEGLFNYDLISEALQNVGLTSLRGKREKLRAATPAASLSLTSDYNLQQKPSYAVEDPSTGPAELMDSIGCYIGQIRGRDIGVSMEEGDPNPDFKPYIALVDGSLCEDSGGTASMLKWAVRISTTAPEGGDGKYTSQFTFFMHGFQLWGQLVNTVTGGTLVKSELVFNQGPDAMTGGIVVNREDPTKTTVKFVQKFSQGGQSSIDQLSVQYNPITGTGQAMSSEGGNDVYKVAFSDSAYLRQLNSNNPICIEFNSDKSLTSADSYILFDASDGSRSLFSSGSMITSPDGSKEAYVDAWGAWSFDGDNSWLVNDASVKKVGYSATGDKNYKLKVANGKLYHVKTLKLKMSDLTQAPLSVYEGGSISRKVAWSGTQLETVESLKTMCVRYTNDGFDILNSDVSEQQKCFCYDSNDSLQSVGAFDYSSNLSPMEKTSVLTTPTAFAPTSAEFPNGVEIRVGDLWGKINLKYENSQKLFMKNLHTYTVGDVVTQESTGAKGKVAVTTPKTLMGYTCNNCVTFTSTHMTDCATFATQSTSMLPAGTVLKQGGIEAVVLSETHYLPGGIPIEYTTNGAFNMGVDLTVDFPSTGGLRTSWGQSLSNIQGTLTKTSDSAEGNVISTLEVKLDAGSAKFAPGSSAADTVKVNGNDKGYFDYAESFSGKAEAVTADTEVAFQVWSTLQPGATVPELLCYENCPDPTNLNTCEAYGSTDCFYPSVSHMGTYGNADQFQCTSSSSGQASNLPTTGSFANIQGTPAATVTWEENPDGSGGYIYTPTVVVTDVGFDCSTETLPKFTMTDSSAVCANSPTLVVTFACIVGNDKIDFGRARKYAFDSSAGSLTVAGVGGADVSIPSSNSNYYSNNGDYKPSVHFGPFFVNNDASKSALKCEFNDAYVCPFQVYQSDSFYIYESGQLARRFTLEDSSGGSLFFSSPLSLKYVHSGTVSNSGKSYDGATSMLTYRGPGQLTGLPLLCIDGNTGKKATECIPSGAAESTSNVNDIRIDPAALLTDVNGNQYYAKFESVSEIYPVASGGQSNPLCSSLALPDGTGEVQLPAVEDVYFDPPNKLQSFPDDATLQADFLYGGDPAVIQGSTLKELEAAAKALAEA